MEDWNLDPRVWAMVAIGLGLVLWLAGRKFVRPLLALVVAGLGVLLVSAFTQLWTSGQSWNWLLCIPAAIVGAVAGWWCFRPAMGLTVGLILALGLPLGYLVTVGRDLPPMHVPSGPVPVLEDQDTHGNFARLIGYRTGGDHVYLHFAQAPQPEADSDVPNDEPETETPSETPGRRPQEPGLMSGKMLDRLGPETYLPEAWVPRQLQDYWKRWWDALSHTDRTVLPAVAILGLLMGLLVGARYADMAASMLTALLGATLAMGGVYALLRLYNPQRAELIDQQPGFQILLLIGLMLVGGSLQAALWRSGSERAATDGDGRDNLDAGPEDDGDD